MKYSIIALPEDKTLKQLNKLRVFFYKNNFRYDNKPPTSDVHITLSELDTKNISILKPKLDQIFSDFNKFEVKWDEVTNEKHEPTEEHPYKSTWIALKLEDSNLHKIFDLLSELLNEENISKNKDYNLKFIANHLNLCNYARIDKAVEAKSIIEEKIPKSFLIDKIALKNLETKKYEWTKNLN